ncbi:hypothetical protein [Streptomyces sp. CB03234]|uniref:hypothetical protein n=1 Tax=Streptomyces sp. (strain CB03234) TaxID=1703937 RepID=UPI001301808F|nr:hypothetical protein [Streptomyces sp. CB03234]
MTQVTQNLLPMSRYEQFTALAVGASPCCDARFDNATGFAIGGFPFRVVAAALGMQ